MKVLYFDWFSQATEWLRLTPLDYISHPDLSLTRSTETNINFGTLSAYDTIIIERPSSSASLNLIKSAKDLHKKVIVDFDDNVLRIDKTNPMYYHYANDKANIIECVALADEVWVSTEAVRQSFRLYNKNIQVIPNAFNDYVYKNKKPFVFNKRVLYRGGHSHIGDIYREGVTENILKLINGHKKTEFVFVGQQFEYIEMRVKYDNYCRYEGASTVQFYKYLQDIEASLFFYPLANTLFNRGKSNCSFFESVYAGCAFFGCKYLPEFDLESIIDIDELFNNSNYYLKNADNVLGNYHDMAWEYIKDRLLLSNVNEMRKGRLLAI